MRKDMAKLIVERPRVGGKFKTPKGSCRRQPRSTFEDLPGRESIRRQWSIFDTGRKELSFNIAPLRRFLNSRVGNKWDKVFSEISEHLKLTSSIVSHALEWLYRNVDIIVHNIDGEYCDDHCHPISNEFYVDPMSGILFRNPNYYRLNRTSRGPEEKHIVEIDGHAFKPLNDIWYELTLEPVPNLVPKSWRHASPSVFDYFLKERIYSFNSHLLIKAYGRQVYATKKQQVGKKDLKLIRAHLKNHANEYGSFLIFCLFFKGFIIN